MEEKGTEWKAPDERIVGIVVWKVAICEAQGRIL